MENTFLGTGWSFPPAFSNNGADVQMVSAEEDILQSLHIILSTEIGERTMHPKFGCNLSAFLFEEIGQELLDRIRRTIEDALLIHELRMKIDNVDVLESDAEPGVLLISIDYTIRATNSRYNMVYPFYINEAITYG